MLQRAGTVGAATLVLPPAALARSRPSAGVPDGLTSMWVGRLAGESPPLPAPRRFALVGLEWAREGASGHDQVWLRTRVRDGAWSRWVLASVGGHGPDDAAADPARAFGEPLWAGAADVVQLRSVRPLAGVRLHFVSVDRRLAAAAAAPNAAVNPAATAGGATAGSAAGFPRAQPVLDAGPGQPPIIARQAWAQGQAPPAVSPGYGEVLLAFVHHTENLNGYGAADVPAMLFAMYQFHRYTRGWNDIGYNFVIDAFGRIWEARKGGIDQAVIGAQAGGYNAVSTGVAMLGSFVSVLPPPAAMTALQRLLAWKLSLHGVPVLGRVRVEVNPSDAFYTPFAPGAHVLLPRIAGHRDGDSTDCPGDALYARLPSVRTRVVPLAAGAARVTLAAPTRPAPVAGAVPVHGRLGLLTGRPLAGAPVELQLLTASGSRTIAVAHTARDGSFSAVLPLEVNARVRALHRARPATTSPLLGRAVPPALTLGFAPGSPPEVTGTVQPAKRHVTIEVDRLLGTAHVPVLRRTLTVNRGTFIARLPALVPGRYALSASTVADDSNAVGRAELVVRV